MRTEFNFGERIVSKQCIAGNQINFSICFSTVRAASSENWVVIETLAAERWTYKWKIEICSWLRWCFYRWFSELWELNSANFQGDQFKGAIASRPRFCVSRYTYNIFAAHSEYHKFLLRSSGAADVSGWVLLCLVFCWCYYLRGDGVRAGPDFTSEK